MALQTKPPPRRTAEKAGSTSPKKTAGTKTKQQPSESSDTKSGSPQPSIYCLDIHLLGEFADWSGHLDRVADLGFSHALITCRPGARSDSKVFDQIFSDQDRVRQFAKSCIERRLSPMFDMATPTGESSVEAALDPRRPETLAGNRPGETIEACGDRLKNWIDGGVQGVRCHFAPDIAPEVWRQIWRQVFSTRNGRPRLTLAWLPNRSRQERAEALSVFDFAPSSASWWNGDDAWLVEEYNELRPHGRLIGFPHDPVSHRAMPGNGAEHLAQCRFRIGVAASLADGWLAPMGVERGVVSEESRIFTAPQTYEELVANSDIDLSEEIREANARLRTRAPGASYMRAIACEGATAVHRPNSDGDLGGIVMVNGSSTRAADIEVASLAVRIGAAVGPSTMILQPLQVAEIICTEPIRPVRDPDPIALPTALASPRLAIENVSPSAGKRDALKRLVGDRVVVEADIIADGHEVLAADVSWRAVDEPEWRHAPMSLIVNDRWRASITLLRPGRHEFRIEAWRDEFGTFRSDLAKKYAVGADVSQDLIEGRALLDAEIKHAGKKAADALKVFAKKIDEAEAHPHAIFLSPELSQLMRRSDDISLHTRSENVFVIDADRPAASFASWYELFPRSLAETAEGHGTLRNVIAHLPVVREMGFDVLYFPPIHPIGRKNRKGRNNSLVAEADEPGSPYAIGSEAGGHEALHPQLGSFDDFKALVAAAKAEGLEIALDFAIQCSPDHPWIRQHPEWFRWRSDGSIKYAENPPKKYEDIVNVDFYGETDAKGLWEALRDVVQGWVDLGVRTFRVDNPHTKPFPFWEWLIADIRSRDPGVIFLAEAFTRPKIMYRLGALGFSQSYTYFTWRNTKAELGAYLSELNAPPARDIYRPHFFVNTPDINPVFLQTSGRPGFLIRAALAATLSGLWGVYSGFELCEADALSGKEEYLNSEKYEIRVRSRSTPGNIIAEITRLNAIRRAQPALQSHLNFALIGASGESIFAFCKHIEGSPDLIVVRGQPGSP